MLTSPGVVRRIDARGFLGYGSTMTDETSRVARMAGTPDGAARYARLPEDKRHWIPATVSRGCMAVNLDTKPHCRDRLLAACTRLLTKRSSRRWRLPEDKRHRQPAGSFRTDEVMGWFHRGSGTQLMIFFDRRMAPYIREAIGLPAALPRDRRHWVSVTTAGCSRMGIERRKDHTVALRRICARLLERPDKRWSLPQGIDPSEPAGRYRPAAVIRIYTNTGQPPVYYFDPRLIQAGIITKQAIKAEAASLTPQDLAAPDPRLIAERAKMPPAPARRWPVRPKARRRRQAAARSPSQAVAASNPEGRSR